MEHTAAVTRYAVADLLTAFATEAVLTVQSMVGALVAAAAPSKDIATPDPTKIVIVRAPKASCFYQSEGS